MQKLFDLWRKYRRRFAPVILVVGIVVVGKKLFSAYPHEVEVCIEDVSPGDLNLEYRIGGEHYRNVRENVSATSYCDRTTMAPGRYHVVVTQGEKKAEGGFYVPTSGIVKISFANSGETRK